MSNSNSWAGDSLFVNLPSDQILAALGEIGVLFSGVEEMLGVVIASLIHPGEPNIRVGIVVATEMSFRAKIALASCLAKERDSSALVARVDRWLNELVKVEERRNQFMHSRWLGDRALAAIRTKETAKKAAGYKVHDERVDLDQLRSLIRDLRTGHAGGLGLAAILAQDARSRDDPSTGGR